MSPNGNVSTIRSPFHRILSTQTRQEIKQLLNLSWPTILSYFLHNALFTISLLFAGRLGETELAATVLSMSFIVITGTFLGSAFITAIEVLCAQAYRSRSYRLVGLTLQRGVWVLGIMVLMVWALWINAEPLLLVLKQKKDLARLSQLFVFIWFPALVADYAFVLIQRYLQIQGVFKPVIYVGVTANVMHVGISTLLIKGADLGFQGLALASCLTFCLFLGVSAFLYLFFCKFYHRTWPVEGWTIESLQNWGQFTMLAVPGMLMLCTEWWGFEVGTFLMGAFGKQQLAAHGILMQFSSFVYMIPLGLSVVVSVRVKNYLGKGDCTGAKHVMKISIVAVCCFTGLFSVLFITLREHLGKAFTASSEIVSLVSKVTPAMTGFSIFLSIQVTCCGIIRGCGRPKLGLVINFIFYCCVALPMAWGLAFYVFSVGVEGFWWGITAAVALQVNILIAALCSSAIGWNLLFEAEIFSSFSSVVLASFFLTEQKEKRISAFKALTFIAVFWQMDWNKYAKKAPQRVARQRPTSLYSWSTGNERGDEENLVVTWLSRTSSLFSVNTNSLREFTNPPDPVMSWIYHSSSLLNLNTTPLRDMNRDHQNVLLENGPSGRDRFNHARKQLGIYGNKMTSQEKRSLIVRRVVWLTLSVAVLVSAIVVRVSLPLSEEEPVTFSAGNTTKLLTNSTKTY